MAPWSRTQIYILVFSPTDCAETRTKLFRFTEGKRSHREICSTDTILEDGEESKQICLIASEVQEAHAGEPPMPKELGVEFAKFLSLVACDKAMRDYPTFDEGHTEQAYIAIRNLPLIHFEVEKINAA